MITSAQGNQNTNRNKREVDNFCIVQMRQKSEYNYIDSYVCYILLYTYIQLQRKCDILTVTTVRFGGKYS